MLSQRKMVGRYTRVRLNTICKAHIGGILCILLVPDKPVNIAVDCTGPRSFNVSWEIGNCEAGETNYTVFAIDKEDANFVFNTTVNGLYVLKCWRRELLACSDMGLVAWVCGVYNFYCLILLQL